LFAINWKLQKDAIQVAKNKQATQTTVFDDARIVRFAFNPTMYFYHTGK
jgi:hypothetical protein